MVPTLRRTVALFATVALSLAAADGAKAQSGTWVLVGALDDTTAYLDSAIVATSDPEIIDVFVRSVFARVIVERGRNGISYDSRIARHRINCRRNLWTHIETRYYRGESLERRNQRRVGRRWFPPRWPQDTMVLQTACRMAAIPP